MAVGIVSVPLTNAVEWDALKAIISPDQNPKNLTLPNLLERLRSLGAVSALVEHEYLDRDFTAEFSAFYSKLFARYGKVCKRVHFFSAPTAYLLKIEDPQQVSEQLEKVAETHYLGFMVARPVRHAPVGRTVIAGPKNPDNMISKLLVRSNYEVHLLGAHLTVVGVPLIQQDTRVGACAQAAIWTAARHFHSAHKGDWISVSEITEEALKQVEATSTTALPAGSGHLTLNGMVRALRNLGREPFSYLNPRLFDKSKDWATDPTAVICRYIDSGIPVILVLSPLAGTISHAIVAVGQTTKTLPVGTDLGQKPTRAVFCEAILVNDDQRGAYLRLPVKTSALSETVPHEISKHLDVILVPLPAKVFRLAESAEEIAWDLLSNFYVPEMPKIRANNQFDFGTSVQRSDEFIQSIAQGKVIARTYLTYGWKYRRRIVRNIVSSTVKAAVIRHDLPRYVWVTEFGTFDSMNHLQPVDKRIFAHIVVDATSSQFHRSALFFHAPGVIKRWEHASQTYDGSLTEKIIPVANDEPYYPKVRGVTAL